MKVYLASQFARQAELARCREDLLAIGWHVTASWLDEEDDSTEDYAIYAENDLRDIDSADAIIFFSGPPYYGDLATVARGGRHFELGYAYHSNKLCIIIGSRENLFHYLPNMQRFETWAGFLRYLTV